MTETTIGADRVEAIRNNRAITRLGANAQVDVLLTELDRTRKELSEAREVLEKIRDFQAEQDPELSRRREDAFAQVRECPDCQKATKRAWPPSGMCNTHYSRVADVDRSIERDMASRREFGPRKIASRYLEGT